MFEICPPFRWRMKVERHGPLTRIIFAWFSVSYIGAGVNQMAQAFRLNEREACAKLCEDYSADRHALYKGRSPYSGAEPGRATDYVQGESDGAMSCAEAIRVRGEQEER